MPESRLQRGRPRPGRSRGGAARRGSSERNDDASGLICLFDSKGPTGTPVKDAQRTKTHDATRATLSIVWGTSALADRTRAATRWYRDLMEICGAKTEDVVLTS